LAVQKLIEKQMITNYSTANHRTSIPYIGNTYIRHSTAKL